MPVPQPDVQHATSAELVGDRAVDLEVAAVGVERVVHRGQPRMLEDGVSHAARRAHDQSVLRRLPVRGELVEHERARARDRDPLLRERVAVADRDRLVLERLLVDRERERRADLVLAAVAPADLARVVVLGDDDAAKLLVQRARAARPCPRCAG